jgi:exopolysaccharide biosynthesis polyprenyl glycosylphosphotransferase
VTTVLASPTPTTDDRHARQPARAPLRYRRRAARAAFLAAWTGAAGAAGALSLVAAYAIAVSRPLAATGFAATFDPYRPVLVFATATRAALFLASRPDRNRRPAGAMEEVFAGTRQAIVGSVALVLFTFFWRGGDRFRSFSYSRSVFMIDAALAAVFLSTLIVVVKLSLRWLRAVGRDRRRIVVIGTVRSAQPLLQAVAERPETGYQVVARIDPEDASGPAMVDALLSIAAATAVDEVVVTAPGLDRDTLIGFIGSGPLRAVKLRAVPDCCGLQPSKVEADELLDLPMLSLFSDPRAPLRRRVSRALDLVVGALLLVISAPLFLAAAAAVRVTSRGPTFFRQERLGMDGRPFRILKLRTMHEGSDTSVHLDYMGALIRGDGGPESSEGLYKLVDDGRITAVGRWLRKYSVDELPQLFNVIKGDMSLVGPRPPLPSEVGLYAAWQRRRLDVRPGLTGLWQVSGRSRMSFDDMVRLDLQYIDQWSPLGDLRILLRTIPAVLRRESS